MTQILILIVVVLSAAYLGASIYKGKRVPESISETSYIWEQDCKNQNTSNGSHKAHLFSLYCAIIAALLFWSWMSATHENFKFLCFLGCTGILGAAMTPFFKEKYQAPIHYGGGILAVICWVAWTLCVGHFIELVAALVMIFLLIMYKKESYVFWVEVVGLVMLLYCIY